METCGRGCISVTLSSNWLRRRRIGNGMECLWACWEALCKKIRRIFSLRSSHTERLWSGRGRTLRQSPRNMLSSDFLYLITIWSLKRYNFQYPSSTLLTLLLNGWKWPLRDWPRMWIILGISAVSLSWRGRMRIWSMSLILWGRDRRTVRVRFWGGRWMLCRGRPMKKIAWLTNWTIIQLNCKMKERTCLKNWYKANKKSSLLKTS